MSLRASNVFTFLLLLATFAHGQGFAPIPANLDFEEGRLNEVPSGWAQPKGSREGGYIAQLTTDRPKSGKQCVLIASGERADTRTATGRLEQSFDATPYRGKRVRFRASVRTDITTAYGNRAGLWMRIDRSGKERGFFDQMQDRPINTKEWQEYEIVGDVAMDAAAIFIGGLLLGQGGWQRPAPLVFD